MKTYGLVGRNIEYSFSRNYFKNKFEKENISAVYRNFDLDNIQKFPDEIKKYRELSGLNVTIPYKEQIIPFLDRLDPVAREIGAVNTIRFEGDGSLTGYNTDQFGFTESLLPFLQPHHRHALILGTGGASKAIAYALKKLKIAFSFVSRKPGKDQLSYKGLSEKELQKFTLIINSTPLGTHPNTEEFPPVPVEHLGPQHLIFDLVYNPPVTRLMQLALEKGAIVLNGEAMLVLQAEKSWEIWNRL